MVHQTLGNMRYLSCVPSGFIFNISCITIVVFFFFQGFWPLAFSSVFPLCPRILCWPRYTAYWTFYDAWIQQRWMNYFRIIKCKEELFLLLQGLFLPLTGPPLTGSPTGLNLMLWQQVAFLPDPQQRYDGSPDQYLCFLINCSLWKLTMFILPSSLFIGRPEDSPMD